ncbi:Uncharacterised protein [Mycobacteroides abscessus subsp. abscessus]|nr:Uncharacterised protein [Mycobacteroides abscessus subsp. abscessus]
MKLTGLTSFDVGYSTRRTAVSTAIGTEMTVATSAWMIEPTIAGAIPAP